MSTVSVIKTDRPELAVKTLADALAHLQHGLAMAESVAPYPTRVVEITDTTARQSEINLETEFTASVKCLDGVDRIVHYFGEWDATDRANPKIVARITWCPGTPDAVTVEGVH